MHTVSHLRVLTFVLQSIRRYMPSLALITVLSVAATAMHLAQPWFYKQAVDVLTSGSVPNVASYHSILRFFLLGLLTAFIGFTIHEASTIIFGTVQANIMQQISAQTFAHAQRLSTKFHINTFAGSTARKIGRGIGGIETMLDRLWFDIFPACFFVIILSGILFSISRGIGSIMLVGIVLYVLLSTGLNIFLSRLFSKADEQDSKVTASMVDAFAGNALVKAFASHSHEEMRHRAIVYEWKKRLLVSWRFATVFGWLQSVSLLVLELCLLLYTLQLWLQGTLSAGTVLMMTFYMGHMWGYMRQIGNHIRNYLRAVANCEEMVALMETPVEIDDIQDAKELIVTKGSVSIEHLHFRYNDGPPLFTDLSLTVHPKEKLAFVGHSGAGKSTLTKLLMRLYELTEGHIRIDGQDIHSVTQKSLRSSMSLVPQDPVLFHRSIAENIAYAKPDASREDIVHAAQLAHAHEFIAALPHGYDTLVGERGVKLSGGERQRVAIARAILADKPILILDEATSSLDSVSEKHIQDALAYLMQNRTAIIIAHRLSTVRSCDRIAVLDKGRLIACAPHEELLKTCPLYKEMVDLQSHGMLGE